MNHPYPAPSESGGVITVRILSGVFGLSACGLWILCTLLVLSSLYSSNPASDPHGYGIVFGTLIGVPSGVVGALVLPMVFPRRCWGRAYLIATPVFIAVAALQFLAMYLS